MALSCSVAKGSHLFYTWLFNRKEVTSLTSPPVLLTGNELVMGKVAPEHAGYYSCMAWSEVQGDRRFSSSQEVQMTVKAYLSKPRISYSIFKQGASRYGNVTCWSTRGSPPVNISLSVNDKEVGSVTGAQSLVAWFLVAMAPRQDTAVARCRVKTEVQELTSEPVTLEMVPVGGHVKVEVEYLYSADSKLVAAKLTCQVSRGTFPHISWLLNNSSLPSETHEDSLTHPVPYHGALADRRRTLFLAKLGPEESGYYVCRARDSYNDSGAWLESAAVLVGVTVLMLFLYRHTHPRQEADRTILCPKTLILRVRSLYETGGTCTSPHFHHRFMKINQNLQLHFFICRQGNNVFSRTAELLIKTGGTF
uniref:Ig-like domain-containing protein n=1 Tax=Gasterosteus aculeatus aculeatus TaxID=481459 RepID=A0AAQ4RLW5_GASAC